MNLPGMIVSGDLAVVCFVISCFQFAQKGFLFNNAYIYASPKKRKEINKKAYYIQSGIVFLLLGIVFSLNVVNMIFEEKWILAIMIVFIVITVIYALISSAILAVKEETGKTQ